MAVDGQPTKQQSLGELFATASTDLSTLVRSEVALAKAEVRADLKQAAAGSGLFAVAAFLGFLASIVLSIAAAYGLFGLGLARGWSFLIVGGAYLLIAGLLAAVGARRLKRVKAPERTIRTAKGTAAWAKNPRQPA